MSNNKIITFCDEMRKATREVHAVSDALVNAKLALGLHNDKVWADGLLVFYEIFMYLEKAMTTNMNANLKRFKLLELDRTKAFELDLSFYLGKDWMKNYSPRPATIKYVNHLKKLESTNPILLIAYIYHLYMGLLSGGIILRKKRELMNKIMPFKSPDKLDGNHVTDFNNRSIYQLKMNMRKTMNEIAETMDDDIKKLFIEESKKVFSMNNEIIRSSHCCNCCNFIAISSQFESESFYIPSWGKPLLCALSEKIQRK
ncbi:hypothetical protein PV328_011633 [Microctonus aethiopoides]|uniref:Heme oxygenase n=1 Tax=Microctonus aethiopoides TaxID=144406 RepID=A0AA39EYS1_9HYME|nr:hypothetical protein PV328_011633 [Microctonus aethiopoides]